MDLDVNESKTEFVCLFLAFPCEVEDNGDNKPCPGGPVNVLGRYCARRLRLSTESSWQTPPFRLRHLVRSGYENQSLVILHIRNVH